MKELLFASDEKLVFCKECGEEVWVGELDDYNAEVLWETYRKKQGGM